MTALTPAPLRCAEARVLVSERLDGADVGRLLEVHLRGCRTCAAFEDTALGVRRALRLPEELAGPDGALSTSIMAAIDALGTAVPELDLRPPDNLADELALEARTVLCGDGARAGGAIWGAGGAIRGRPRLLAGVAVLAVFALCAAIGFASAHWQGGTMPAVANDRSSVVSDGQVRVQAVQARVSLLELGADGADTRRADGSLAYAAPESVTLRLSDGAISTEVGVNGEMAWRLGPDPGGVRGRQPFDPAGWSALEVVVPVDAFGRDPGAVVATTLDGHPTWQITTTVAQVSELLDAFRTGLTWRPLNPADRVTLWLDRDSAVPRRVEVAASTDRDRATWAARQALVEPTRGPTFVIELTDLVVNGADAEVPAPPTSSESRDLGFVDRTVANAELPEPTWLPAGVTPYRSGERLTPGGAGSVVERTWTNGRSWLKVSGTRQWTGDRLFGDLGPLVRPLGGDPDRDLGGAGGDNPFTGPLYRSESGDAVAIHGDTIDVVVTGSVSEDDLVRVARSLELIPRPVPAHWPEAGARSLDGEDAAERLAALSDRWGPALAPPAGGASDLALLDHGDSVEISVTGPGARGIRIVQSAGDVLAPVEDPDARAVSVRGTTGRYSPTLDELTWTERGRVIVMSSHTVTLAELTALAEAMRWSG